MKTISKIDIHHHFFPKIYKAELKKSGQDQLINPSWKKEDSLRLMDEGNISKAYLSLPFAPTYHTSIIEKGIVRECNESAAAIIRAYPDRFGAFASIPYMNIDNCLKEIAYSLDVLNLDGIILYSNTEGEIPYPSDLDDLYSELDKRKAVVFVHPNTSAKKPLLDAPAYKGDIEYYFDIARFIVAQLFNGTLEKYPNIRYILANGGGIVPFYAQRISKPYYLNGKRLRWGRIIKDMSRRKNSGEELLSNLYYETATVLERDFISALKNMVDSEHILFGSNYGENQRNDLNISIDQLILDGILNEPEACAVFSLNAKRLLEEKPHR